MSSPDETPDAQPPAAEPFDPVQDRTRRFAILSRDDSLKGPAILWGIGLILILVSALIGSVPLADVLLGVAVALPINLFGMFIAASVLGISFGSLRSAVARLTSIIVLLQGLSRMVSLGYDITDSVVVLVGAGAVVCVIGFALIMEFFNLSIFETCGCLFILAATETGTGALLRRLEVIGLARAAETGESLTAVWGTLAQQIPL